MPARQSSGGGAKKPKVVKLSTKAKSTTPSSAPTKVYSDAKSVNRSYGPGPVTVASKNGVAKRVTKIAVKRFNAQADFRVFKQIRAVKRADVVVSRMTEKNSRRQFAAATGSVGSVKLNKSIAKPIPPGAPHSLKGARARIIQHELGHTLGIMHPGPKQNEYLAAVTKHPHLSEKRWKALVKRSRESGIVGSGRRLNTKEAAMVKELRAAVKSVVGKKPRKSRHR